ncbi:MAG: hypothetical protein MJ252_28870 [archaeon]|nr:hypothetical protein [archaeon]
MLYSNKELQALLKNIRVVYLLKDSHVEEVGFTENATGQIKVVVLEELKAVLSMFDAYKEGETVKLMKKMGLPEEANTDFVVSMIALRPGLNFFTYYEFGKCSPSLSSLKKQSARSNVKNHSGNGQKYEGERNVLWDFPILRINDYIFPRFSIWYSEYEKQKIIQHNNKIKKEKEKKNEPMKTQLSQKENEGNKINKANIHKDSKNPMTKTVNEVLNQKPKVVIVKIFS